METMRVTPDMLPQETGIGYYDLMAGLFVSPESGKLKDQLFFTSFVGQDLIILPVLTDGTVRRAYSSDDYPMFESYSIFDAWDIPPDIKLDGTEVVWSD